MDLDANQPSRRRAALGPAGAIAAAAIALTSCATEDRAIGGDSYSAIADELAAYAESIAEKAHVPATAIGIVTRDGLVESRFLGSNYEGIPLTPQTLFEIGSSTKAFLGATEAILVDRGNLAWEDRVIDHYPDFKMQDPWVTKEFRIDDLISQRSGLPEFSSELVYSFGFPWEDNVKGLQYLTPESSFRTTFAYQNIPHVVAGEIVADKVGANSWNEAAEELLFTPLEMSRTRTDIDALLSSDDTTRGHTLRNNSAQEVPLNDFPSIAEGAGSIVSNLDDMSKWVALHLNNGAAPGGQVVSTEQLQRTYLPLVPVTDPYFLEYVGMGDGSDSSVSYATGWFVHSHPEGRVIQHGGNTGGYNSAVGFDPDRGVGIVILTNQGFDGGAATHMGKYGMDLLQGREPLDYYDRMQRYNAQANATAQAELDAIADEAKPLEWYAGTYTHELLGSLELRASGDDLTSVVGPKSFDATFERQAGHRFMLRWDPEDPATDWEESPARFEGTGDHPDRLTIDGFVFERAGN